MAIWCGMDIYMISCSHCILIRLVLSTFRFLKLRCVFQHIQTFPLFGGILSPLYSNHVYIAVLGKPIYKIIWPHKFIWWPPHKIIWQPSHKIIWQPSHKIIWWPLHKFIWCPSHKIIIIWQPSLNIIRETQSCIWVWPLSDWERLTVGLYIELWDIT